MAAQFSTQNHSASRRHAMAAACTSAPVCIQMDTAMILAVSIIVVMLRLWVSIL